MDRDLLLFPVAALLVEPDVDPLWYRRLKEAYGAVISDFADVSDILLMLPDCWSSVPDARLRGLHDDPDVMRADPRFNGTLGFTGFAVVRHASEPHHVALMVIGAAEATFIPKRPYTVRARFSDSIPGLRSNNPSLLNRSN